MTQSLLSVHVTAGGPTCTTANIRDRESPCLTARSVCSEEEADAQTVLTDVTKLLRSEFSFSGITIQVER